MSKTAQCSYRLASHVHICKADRDIILLDLKRNKYFGFSDTHVSWLARQIQDWPIAPIDGPVPSMEDSRELFASMIENGVLTLSPRLSAPAHPLVLEPPNDSLIDGYEHVQCARRPIDVLNFIKATLTARALLRWCSIERVVQHVRSRKFVAGTSACSLRSAMDTDIATARRCFAVFRILRPLLFTAQDACLLDSLALSEFLMYYDMFPQWIFGVTSDPFAAHCWLQHGTIVINDSPEHVSSFTPIMAV